LKYAYYFRLCVRDASGSLSVLVGEKEADTFFTGLPACNLYQNPTTRAIIEKKLQQILHPGMLSCRCDGPHDLFLCLLRV
jgi:hypothetical protein